MTASKEIAAADARRCFTEDLPKDPALYGAMGGGGSVYGKTAGAIRRAAPLSYLFAAMQRSSGGTDLRFCHCRDEFFAQGESAPAFTHRSLSGARDFGVASDSV